MIPWMQKFCVASFIAACVDGATVHGRHAHWAVRTTNLERSINFYKSVFGLKVLRHEEHEGACEITCNGHSDTPWSKTIMGDDTEDRSYALELTFNYGVFQYPKGEALRDIALRLRQPLPDAVMAAGELGYGPAQSNGTSVHLTGPDGYRYVLLPLITNDDELDDGAETELPTPFDHIRLRVQNLEASMDFYTEVLGMTDFTEAATLREKPSEGYMTNVRVVGYEAPDDSPSAVPLFLEEHPDQAAVTVTDWEGRHAVTMPEEQLRQVYKQIREKNSKHIVHELREIKDPLGNLLIAVVKDPDGLEVALLSSEGFDSAARAADDFAEPDWERRKEIAKSLNVAVGSEATDATNIPEWSFEQEMEKHPEIFAGAQERTQKMLDENIAKQKQIQEMVEDAQRVVESGDEEAIKAIDFEKIQTLQSEVDAYINRHQASGKVKEAIEQAKMQAGGGVDQRKLKDIAANMAEKAEEDPDDEAELASHEEL